MPTNEKLVLVVEDDEPKLRAVIGFLRENLHGKVEILSSGSLSSAIRVLSTRRVHLAIVDMSLPTFDFATDSAGGGQPQGFGGADILRFIHSETESTLSVALTQYEEFTLSNDGVRRDLASLAEVLRQELDSRFLGVVHYSGQHGEWQRALLGVLDAAEIGDEK